MNRFVMLLVVVGLAGVIGGRGSVNTTRRGENCTGCGVTSEDDAKCRAVELDHAVLRHCGHSSVCLFCADERGVLTPVEDPRYERQATASVSSKFSQKRHAAQDLAGVEVVVTPEIQRVIDKCLDAGGVVDGVGANGVICTMAY